MATVVSVDLAFRRWVDIGVAILTEDEPCIRVQFEKLADNGTLGPGDAQTLVTQLLDLVKIHDASVLLIDGPQAWKDPDNGIAHMRICEQELRTPAKTGLPGDVKPRTWMPFVSFSIDVFDTLEMAGFERLVMREPSIVRGDVLMLEVFPTAAWRGLRMSCLPGKTKAKREDVTKRFDELVARYCLQVERAPSHDELQALVSGLAGIAIARGRVGEYSVHGVPPRQVDGIWREGFIVNPQIIPKLATPWLPSSDLKSALFLNQVNQTFDDQIDVSTR